MDEAIKTFNKQFEYQPEIINGDKLVMKKGVILAGMGGSALAPALLSICNPMFKLIIHRGYGLPACTPDDLLDYILIASSYSGNTEEVIDAFQTAQKYNIPVAVISTGGKLLEMAKAAGVAYVQLPTVGLQPREALGYSLKGFLKLIGDEGSLAMISKLAASLRPDILMHKGEEIAKKLEGQVPLIYSSELNKPLAYIWKIKFNETAKTPAFTNYFPELNHNEMIGFDGKAESLELNKKFHFIFIKDKADHPRITLRMEVMQKVFEGRGMQVEVVEIEGEDLAEKVFSNVVLADWVAYSLALYYGVNPNSVPMVEDFKKLIG